MPFVSKGSVIQNLMANLFAGLGAAGLVFLSLFAWSGAMLTRVFSCAPQRYLTDCRIELVFRKPSGPGTKRSPFGIAERASCNSLLFESTRILQALLLPLLRRCRPCRVR